MPPLGEPVRRSEEDVKQRSREAQTPTPTLRNHREAIAAMDFFTVPTITFGVLYCFFIISHDRRRAIHRHPGIRLLYAGPKRHPEALPRVIFAINHARQIYFVILG
jgi:hypothetical protein